MNKQKGFLVAECHQGLRGVPLLGACYPCETFTDAINLAVRLVRDRLNDGVAIRNIWREFEEFNDFHDPEGSWSVCIGEFETTNVVEDEAWAAVAIEARNVYGQCHF